jgi:hypothetical protein
MSAARPPEGSIVITRPLLCAFFALLLLPLALSQAADADLAKALAISAAKLDEQGKPEKAKQLCLKALANDEECPEALFLMGVLLEKEGRLVQAGAFFSHAVQAFSQAAGAGPERAEKLKEARKYAQKTNPFGLQLQAAMEQYGKELAAIVEKSPDEVCAALGRKQVENLGLERYLTPAQLAGLKRTSATLPTSPGTTPNPGLPVAANPDDCCDHHRWTLATCPEHYPSRWRWAALFPDGSRHHWWTGIFDAGFIADRASPLCLLRYAGSLGQERHAYRQGAGQTGKRLTNSSVTRLPRTSQKLSPIVRRDRPGCRVAP